MAQSACWRDRGICRSIFRRLHRHGPATPLSVSGPHSGRSNRPVRGIRKLRSHLCLAYAGICAPAGSTSRFPAEPPHSPTAGTDLAHGACHADQNAATPSSSCQSQRLQAARQERGRRFPLGPARALLRIAACAGNTVPGKRRASRPSMATRAAISSATKSSSSRPSMERRAHWRLQHRSRASRR